jgi:hypothetical protein
MTHGPSRTSHNSRKHNKYKSPKIKFCLVTTRYKQLKMVRHLSPKMIKCATKDKDVAACIQTAHQYADFCMHYLSVELKMKQTS